MKIENLDPLNENTLKKVETTFGEYYFNLLLNNMQWTKIDGGRVYNFRNTLPKYVKTVVYEDFYNFDAVALWPSILRIWTKNDKICVEAVNEREKTYRTYATCGLKMSFDLLKTKYPKQNWTRDTFLACVEKYKENLNEAQHIIPVSTKRNKTTTSLMTHASALSCDYERYETKYINAVIEQCKKNGISVITREHDGVVVDRNITSDVFEQIKQIDENYVNIMLRVK